MQSSQPAAALSLRHTEQPLSQGAHCHSKLASLGPIRQLAAVSTPRARASLRIAAGFTLNLAQAA